MLCTPKPNGFADHYPVFKWLFHWEYTLFSDKPTFLYFLRMESYAMVDRFSAFFWTETLHHSRIAMVSDCSVPSRNGPTYAAARTGGWSTQNSTCCFTCKHIRPGGTRWWILRWVYGVEKNCKVNGFYKSTSRLQAPSCTCIGDVSMYCVYIYIILGHHGSYVYIYICRRKLHCISVWYLFMYNLSLM